MQPASGRRRGTMARYSFVVLRRTPWNLRRCWIAPAGADRRRPRSASTRGWRPSNKGLRYPRDPPTVEEIVAVMRAAGDSAEGVRLRGIIIVMRRAGLRISEALELNE